MLDVSVLRLADEATVKNRIAVHTLTRMIAKRHPLEVDRRSACDTELAVLLAGKTELARADHGRLFRFIDAAAERLGMTGFAIRAFRVRETDGENAESVYDDRRILLKFSDALMALVDDEAEWMAIVGHELGHLLFGHLDEVRGLEVRLEAVAEAVRDGRADADTRAIHESRHYNRLLQNCRLHAQLRELSADRVAAVVCGQFRAAAVAALKRTAGRPDGFGDLNPATCLQQANRLLVTRDLFTEEDTYLPTPHEPLRVKALELYFNSDLNLELFGKGAGSNRLAEFDALLPKLVPLQLEAIVAAEMSALQFDVRLFTMLAAIEVLKLDEINDRERRYLKTLLERSDATTGRIVDYLKRATVEGREGELERLAATVAKVDDHRKGRVLKELVRAANADRRITLKELQRIHDVARRIDAVRLCDELFIEKFGISVTPVKYGGG